MNLYFLARESKPDKNSNDVKKWEKAETTRVNLTSVPKGRFYLHVPQWLKWGLMRQISTRVKYPSRYEALTRETTSSPSAAKEIQELHGNHGASQSQGALRRWNTTRKEPADASWRRATAWHDFPQRGAPSLSAQLPDSRCASCLNILSVMLNKELLMYSMQF